MSRKDELLKLARLFHSQARLTLDPSKQVLRKIGDDYEHEAERLQALASFSRCLNLPRRNPHDI
jgi:hypothetical protein